MSNQLDNIKKDLYKIFDERTARWNKVREQIDSLDLPQFPVDPKASVDIFRDLDLVFPYSPEIIVKVRELMKLDEWSEHDMMQDHQICKYYKNGACVNIRFSINHEDSTCVKTKIGEREQTVSIYEVTCKEGGEENVFIHKETEEK